MQNLYRVFWYTSSILNEWYLTTVAVQTSSSLVWAQVSRTCQLGIYLSAILSPSHRRAPQRENERPIVPEFVLRVPRFNIRACHLDIQWTDISMLSRTKFHDGFASAPLCVECRTPWKTHWNFRTSNEWFPSDLRFGKKRGIRLTSVITAQKRVCKFNIIVSQ